MRCAYFLILTSVIAFTNGHNTRSDDASSVKALEILLQQQASTIQALQARLDAQDTKMLGQTVTIHTLHSSVQQLDTTIQNLQSMVQRQDAIIHGLQTERKNNTIDDLRVTVQQQGNTIGGLQASMQQKDNAISSLQAQVHSMDSKISTQGVSAGFYADMSSHQPSNDVNLTADEPVKFNHVVTNVGHGYSNTTGVFTAPYSGLYVFNLFFAGGQNDEYTFLGIYKNGRYVYAAAYSEGHKADSNEGGSCTAVMVVTRGDEVSVMMDGGNTRIWGGIRTAFSGVLIHPN